MIGELVAAPSLQQLRLPGRRVNRRLHLGLARPVLDLQIDESTVGGLTSLTRSSEVGGCGRGVAGVVRV